MNKAALAFLTISCMLFVVFLAGLAFEVGPVKAESGTIYIRADGGVDGTAYIQTADNVTYVFAANINNSIVVERSNIVIDGNGHTLQRFTGPLGIGIDLSGMTNVTVKNTQIKAFYYGILLDSSSRITISGNNVTANVKCDILLDSSSTYNTISGNNVTESNSFASTGIWLNSSSTHNIIIGNNIANNEGDIMILSSSDYNVISGNNVTASANAIIIFSSSGNTIIHNNFVNNNGQMITDEATVNAWDEGYPSGGNYWSVYGGADLYGGPYQNVTGSDGIGDTTYDSNMNNRDQYPLMAPITSFDAGIWNGTAYDVEIVSNSTLSNLQTDVANRKVIFNVTGPEFTYGFCRVTIPNIIAQDLWHGSFTVLLNNESWPFRNWTDTTNTYVYIDYAHSQHQIAIVPEFPSFLTLSSLMIATSIAVIGYRRKHHQS